MGVWWWIGWVDWMDGFSWLVAGFAGLLGWKELGSGVGGEIDKERGVQGGPEGPETYIWSWEKI